MSPNFVERLTYKFGPPFLTIGSLKLTLFDVLQHYRICDFDLVHLCTQELPLFTALVVERDEAREYFSDFYPVEPNLFAIVMNKLDATLDDVQNTRFGNIYHEFIRLMVRQTQFNEIEITSILMIYHKFVLANGLRAKSMTKKQFFHLFEVLFRIYDLQIIERILLNITSGQKKEVDPVAWVKLFSVFMSSKLEPKMRFAFQVYDTHGMGTLNREIVTHAVEKFFNGDDEDEVNELRSDMIDLIFRKFDVDRDGLISYDDYASVVVKDPLSLEFLGNCLPTTSGMTLTAYCANIMSQLMISKANI